MFLFSQFRMCDTGLLAVKEVKVETPGLARVRQALRRVRRRRVLKLLERGLGQRHHCEMQTEASQPGEARSGGVKRGAPW